MTTRESNLQTDDLMSRIHIVTTVLVGVILCGSVITRRIWQWESAPFPFVWADVALVHFLCALPFSGILTAAILRRTSIAGGLILVGLLVTLSMLLVLNATSTNETTSTMSPFVVGLFLRGTAALGGALATTTLFASFLCRRNVNAGQGAPSSGTGFAVLSAAFLLIAPAIYTTARTRHDLNQLTVLLGQSRLGDAQVLAHGLLAVNSDTTWQGHPVREVVIDLDQKVQAIELRIAIPLAAPTSSQALLDRARDLAVLGRTTAAIDLLQVIPELSNVPDTWNLRGTIHEARREWEAGRESYHRAKLAWESLPQSPESTANRIRAVTGIAYCERKLGRYREAETAYLELLSLSPTADTHFLLAQFYEDTQLATQAQTHARRAMALAPERYHQEGLKLIDKLVTLHFGCWDVFAAENGPSR